MKDEIPAKTYAVEEKRSSWCHVGQACYSVHVGRCLLVFLTMPRCCAVGYSRKAGRLCYLRHTSWCSKWSTPWSVAMKHFTRPCNAVDSWFVGFCSLKAMRVYCEPLVTNICVYVRLNRTAVLNERPFRNILASRLRKWLHFSRKTFTAVLLVKRSFPSGPDYDVRFETPWLVV